VSEKWSLPVRSHRRGKGDDILRREVQDMPGIKKSKAGLLSPGSMD
jgi:hypothetical protein